MKKVIFLLMAFAFVASFLAAQELSVISPSQKVVKMRFDERESFLVMGLEVKGNFDPGAYMDAWKAFFAMRDKLPENADMRDQLPETVDDRIYGLYYPGEKFDPNSMQGHNYLVGMEVKKNVKLPEGLKIVKAPGGFFAVFEHVGSVKNIGDTYEYIFGEWLATSGNVPMGSEMFELYDERFREDSAASVIEIWVPIHKMEKIPTPVKKLVQEPSEEDTPAEQ